MKKLFIVFIFLFVAFQPNSFSQQRQLLMDNFAVGNSVFRINAEEINGAFKFRIQKEDTNYMHLVRRINSIKDSLSANDDSYSSLTYDTAEIKSMINELKKQKELKQDSIQFLTNDFTNDSLQIAALNVEYDRLKISKKLNESLLQNNQSKSFDMFSLDENVFKFRFGQIIDSMIVLEDGDDKEVVENDIQNSADEIYLKIYTIVTTENSAPVAGNIKIQERVRIYPQSYSWESNDEIYFHISHVGISVEDGVISDIRVTGYLENNEQTNICFQQSFGCIPFSTLVNPLDGKDIFNRNEAPPLKGYGGAREYTLYTSDFLFYFPEVTSHSHNISPGDSVYHFDLKGFDYCGPLFREATSKILSYKIYSDPVGFTDDQPNGLIQFEVSKRIIEEHESFKHPYTLFHFIEPQLTWSKIEDNNKALVLESMQDSFYSTTDPFFGKLIDPMDLYRFSNLSLGLKQNLFFTKFGNTSSQLSFNFENNFMRTRLRDSILVIIDTTFQINDSTYVSYQSESLRFNDFSITSIYFAPSLEYVIRPDDRYGLTLGWKSGFINILNDDIHVNNKYASNTLININSF